MPLKATDSVDSSMSFSLLSSIFHSIPIMVAVLDNDLRYIVVSQQYLDFIRSTSDKVLNKTVKEALPPPVYANAAPLLERALAGESISFEIELPTETENKRFISIQYQPRLNAEGEQVGVLMSGIEITSLKKSEEEKRRVQHYLNTTFNSIGHGIAIVNDDKEMVSSNPPFERIVGERFSEIDTLLQDHPFGMIDCLCDLGWRRCPEFSQFVSGSASSEVFEPHSLLVKNNIFIGYKELELEGGGRCYVFTDVTEQIKDKQNLTQQMQYNATIVDNSPNLLCMIDRLEFTILMVNAQALDRIGKTEDEVINQYWFRVFAYGFWNLEEENQMIVNLPSDQVVVSTKDRNGEPMTIQWRFVELDDQSNRVLCFGDDVTQLSQAQQQLETLNHSLEEKVRERTQSLETANEELQFTLKKLQEAQQSLVEAEKMASLGGLVGGVAHEINTPLGISVTATSFLEENVDALSKGFETGNLSKALFSKTLTSLKQSTEILVTNLQRAEKLVCSFKEVAVDQTSQTAYQFNMREIIDKLLLSLSHEIRVAKVTVNLECASNIELESYPSSYIQIFTNLITNSIRHGFDQWDGERNIYIDIQTDMDNLYIVYRDTGKGVHESVREKIFEPFVTTKRGGGGSGLGANIIYNMVVQLLKGNVQCVAEENQGACFKIQVPLDLNIEEQDGMANAG